MKKVLFICTHNAARSQMAEGLLKAIYGSHYEVYSAGTHPAGVHPCAIRVMKEIAIDISEHCSKSLDAFREKKFDYIITLCDNSREACPFFPNARKYVHKGFPDPAQCKGTEEEMLDIFRKIRDDIKEWITRAFNPTGRTVNELQ